jgi:6,7-dimethyl-8-ribityllumazine synthase
MAGLKYVIICRGNHGSQESTARVHRKTAGEISEALKMAEALKPSTIRGALNAAGLRFGIVVSQFNNFITDRLLAGTLDALERSGAVEKQIEIVRVPGSFEIPIAAKKLAATNRFDSIVCIGCILRGETSHYDVVVSETARGIQLAQLDSGVPMILCVLTCDTLEQAINRAGLKGGNKGYESGLAAVEMAHLSRKLSKASPRGLTRSRPRSRR